MARLTVASNGFADGHFDTYVYTAVIKVKKTLTY